MKTILDVIDSQLAQQRPVYVHCWGGRGRTGTVVGCYLARHGIALGEEALDQIRHMRREEETADKPSPETDSQCNMVREWKQGE
jgi:protein-tyrosine phosphatase